jgi:hypothetical protein
LAEQFDGTVGYMEIRNSSDTSLDDAIFYAEYFDSASRFCFSLVFSQEQNLGQKGQVNPAASRRLFSTNAELFPASDVKELKVYLIQQVVIGASNSNRKWDTRVRAPITIDARSLGADVNRIQLNPGLRLSNGPILDLVFAKVSVDENGGIVKVDLLNSANRESESWLSKFIRQARFYPATDNGIPKPGYALLSIRVFLEGEQPTVSARADSPWIKSYMATLTDAEVPPITQVFFHRPPTTVRSLASGNEPVERPAAPQGIVELMFPGTDWSVPAYRWVADQSMPLRKRRDLITSEAR